MQPRLHAEEILKGRSTQFDPKIADIMLQIMDEDEGYSLRQKEKEFRNVLVVDDDSISLDHMERILRDMDGVNVICARTEHEALEVIKSQDISLVILNLRIPDTDGFDLYQKIGTIKADIPAILMLSDMDMQIIQRISELGIDDYITKPLNDAITRETVHGILHGRSV